MTHMDRIKRDISTLIRQKRISQNPNCDGDQCRVSAGTVRKMPMGSGGNGILCYACWAHELRFRRDRNRTLESFAQMPLPHWERAEVVTG